MKKEFIDFIISAKKATYADGKAEKIKSTREGSFDYEYIENNMKYHDTYFGGTNFMGEEIVYIDENPVWGMNYYGITLDKTLSEDAIDKALRPALSKVGEDDILPVRGPKEYKNNDYTYSFIVNGDLEYFDGIETIYKNNNKIYELKCHGGLIKR